MNALFKLGLILAIVAAAGIGCATAFGLVEMEAAGTLMARTGISIAILTVASMAIAALVPSDKQPE